MLMPYAASLAEVNVGANDYNLQAALSVG